jgi:hypothetical protein
MCSDAAESSGTRLSRISPVLPAGIATTVLTLLGNWWLSAQGFDPMGIYIGTVIPLGATLVGMLAASGYILVAWLRGEKISRMLMTTVFVLQCLAYLQAQYSEYSHVDPRHADGTPVGFPEFFDATTRSIAFRGKNVMNPGRPLGAWGYGVRALDVLGFAGGAVFALAALGSTAYCERCERYMRRRPLVTLPASVAPKKLWRADAAGKEEHELAQAKAAQKCREWLTLIVDEADLDQADTLRRLIAEFRSARRQTNKLPSRLLISLTSCPSCNAGSLAADYHTGRHEQSRCDAILRCDVSPDLVRNILAG